MFAWPKKWDIAKYEVFNCIKKWIKNIKIGETGIKKHKFHQHKNPVSMYNVDINKTLVANKVSFGKMGFKYFIGY